MFILSFFNDIFSSHSCNLFVRIVDADIGRRTVIEYQIRRYKIDILSVKGEQFIDTNIINANYGIRRRSIDAVYERVNGT